jgi:hypothetical protein
MFHATDHTGGIPRPRQLWPLAARAILLAVLLAASGRMPALADPAVRFAADGALVRPEGYRQWVFIGAPITPDPQTFAHWQETGGFRTGAVVVQERVNVGSTREMSGNGFFPGRFIGLQVMVKDVKRFPETIWGFFSFGSPPYADKVKEIEGLGELDCAGCHARGHQDWVFTEFYPILKAARPE